MVSFAIAVLSILALYVGEKTKSFHFLVVYCGLPVEATEGATNFQSMPEISTEHRSLLWFAFGLRIFVFRNLVFWIILYSQKKKKTSKLIVKINEEKTRKKLVNNFTFLFAKMFWVLRRSIFSDKAAAFFNVLNNNNNNNNNNGNSTSAGKLLYLWSGLRRHKNTYNSFLKTFSPFVKMGVKLFPFMMFFCLFACFIEPIIFY